MRMRCFRLLVVGICLVEAGAAYGGFPMEFGQPAAPQIAPLTAPLKAEQPAGLQQVANPYVATPRNVPVGTARLPQFAPAQAMKHLAEAVRFESNNDIRMAIRAYHHALECDSSNRLALISFGRLKHRIGDLDGAIVTYRQSLKYHPNDAVALNDLGLCHARRGESPSAVSCLTAASRLVPENRRYANNLAIALVETGKTEAALGVLQDAVGAAAAHYNLALLLETQSHLEQSAQHARTALALDPSFSPAKQLLSKVTKSLAGRVALLTQPPTADGVVLVEPGALGEVAPDPPEGTAAEFGETAQAGWNFLDKHDR